MFAHNMSKDDYDQLESYFVNRVASGRGLTSTKKTLVYWEEIFNNNVHLEQDVIVQAWKSDVMSSIIRAGLRTTNSYKWYRRSSEPRVYRTATSERFVRILITTNNSLRSNSQSRLQQLW